MSSQPLPIVDPNWVVDVPESEYPYYEYVVNKDTIFNKLENNESIPITLNGNNYDLLLSIKDSVSENNTGYRFYTRTVANLPNSFAAISLDIDSAFFSATINLNSADKFIIEELYIYDKTATAEQYVGYNMADLPPAPA